MLYVHFDNFEKSVSPISEWCFARLKESTKRNIDNTTLNVLQPKEWQSGLNHVFSNPVKK